MGLLEPTPVMIISSGWKRIFYSLWQESTLKASLVPKYPGWCTNSCHPHANPLVLDISFLWRFSSFALPSDSYINVPYQEMVLSIWPVQFLVARRFSTGWRALTCEASRPRAFAPLNRRLFHQIFRFLTHFGFFLYESESPPSWRAFRAFAYPPGGLI